MRRNKDYTIAALSIPLFIALLATLPYSNTKTVKILKQTTDERGLISVVYTNGKDTFALDYITPIEFKELIQQ